MTGAFPVKVLLGLYYKLQSIADMNHNPLSEEGGLGLQESKG
tara:strand:+ start:31 stop:156 length:126 start_codon:yes stop_codon:yes gene_type:complete